MLTYHPMISKFERLFHLSNAEREAVGLMQIRAVAVDADQSLSREGDRPSRCVIILTGLATTSKTDEDGKRQVTAYHIAGDMPDLPACILKSSTATSGP